MDRAAKKYRGQVARGLRCGRETKAKLLRELDDSLHAFLADEPDADYESIARAFGAPDVMAAVMCEGLPEQEYRAWRRWRLAVCAIAFVLAVVIVSTVAYVIAVYYTTLTTEITETLTIYEGNILSGSSN